MLKLEDINDDEFMQELRQEFYETKKDLAKDFAKAIKDDDIKTASLIAHSLKAIALVINETNLAELSAKAEKDFSSNNIQSQWVQPLVIELERVLRDMGK